MKNFKGALKNCMNIIQGVSAGCPTFQLVITLWPWWYVKPKFTQTVCKMLEFSADGVVVALNGFNGCSSR
jgi:hypothetical protein